ncbi:hypothetical protein [Pseudoruegeria sp. HB172150]|uniref:hypothetical protein n=1 Tax=Pseudoruegeria sp. HB172150 TaxID=2721164 RepID=UPI00155792CF|nr:hypothetical protein [Pseudoruegeria sp. HB172150]
MHFTFNRFIAAAVVSVAGSAAVAQEYWPELETGTILGCEAIEGIGLFRYDALTSGGHKRFMMTETCFSQEDGWFVGAETLQGLELAQEYGPGAGRYEIIEDGDQAFRRRNVSSAPAEIGPTEEDYRLVADPPVLRQSVWVPQQIERYAGYDTVYGEVYSFRSLAEDLDALPEGRWYADSYTVRISRLDANDNGVTDDNLMFGSIPVLFDAGPAGIEILTQTANYSGQTLALDVDGGKVSGQYGFVFSNPVLPAAREPGAYETAVVEINEIMGRLVRDGERTRLVAFGLGRATLRNAAGQVAVDDATLNLQAIPVPPDVSMDVFEDMFPGTVFPD